ncbi:MAG: hypothetical protein HYW90_04690 [Candidatus Sungbacteria bacterium]|nr:hypothetical protein [Candidatus Sungbacteria bacterium]
MPNREIPPRNEKPSFYNDTIENRRAWEAWIGGAINDFRETERKSLEYYRAQLKFFEGRVASSGLSEDEKIRTLKIAMAELEKSLGIKIERKIEVVRESPIAKKEQESGGNNVEDLRRQLAEIVERRERLVDKPEHVDIINHLFRQEQILKEEIRKIEDKDGNGGDEIDRIYQDEGGEG